jgi:hypothetical protein
LGAVDEVEVKKGHVMRRFSQDEKEFDENPLVFKNMNEKRQRSASPYKRGIPSPGPAQMMA